MSSKIKLVKKGSLVLLIIGTILFTGGGYIFNEDCKSGIHLGLENTNNSDNDISSSNITHFNNLTSTEQRIFLEAYTDQNGFSDLYKNWSEGWFNTDSFEPLYITYRGEVVKTSVWASDCGLPVDEFSQSIGVLFGMVGIIGKIGLGIAKVSKDVVS